MDLNCDNPPVMCGWCQIGPETESTADQGGRLTEPLRTRVHLGASVYEVSPEMSLSLESGHLTFFSTDTHAGGEQRGMQQSIRGATYPVLPQDGGVICKGHSEVSSEVKGQPAARGQGGMEHIGDEQRDTQRHVGLDRIQVLDAVSM